MFVLIPPAKPKTLANSIGLMGAHLIFDTRIKAEEALLILAPNYANQFQVTPITELEDYLIVASKAVRGDSSSSSL
jgi:hypothetical protein